MKQLPQGVSGQQRQVGPVAALGQMNFAHTILAGLKIRDLHVRSCAVLSQKQQPLHMPTVTAQASSVRVGLCSWGSLCSSTAYEQKCHALPPEPQAAIGATSRHYARPETADALFSGVTSAKPWHSNSHNSHGQRTCACCSLHHHATVFKLQSHHMQLSSRQQTRRERHAVQPCVADQLTSTW